MKCKVHEIGQGDRFSLGGVIWLTLDHEEAGARADRRFGGRDGV